MCINRDEYIQVITLICKVVQPDFEQEAARAMAAADWLEDAGGDEERMTYMQFFNAFFQLADLWCPNIDATEYEHFLVALLRRVTVRLVTKQDGPTVRQLPVPQKVFVTLAQATAARARRRAGTFGHRPSEGDRAAARIQAHARGRDARKKPLEEHAKEAKAKAAKSFNPDALDLRRPKTKRLEAASHQDSGHGEWHEIVTFDDASIEEGDSVRSLWATVDEVQTGGAALLAEVAAEVADHHRVGSAAAEQAAPAGSNVAAAGGALAAATSPAAASAACVSVASPTVSVGSARWVHTEVEGSYGGGGFGAVLRSESSRSLTIDKAVSAEAVSTKAAAAPEDDGVSPAADVPPVAPEVALGSLAPRASIVGLPAVGLDGRVEEDAAAMSPEDLATRLTGLATLGSGATTPPPPPTPRTLAKAAKAKAGVSFGAIAKSVSLKQLLLQRHSSTFSDSPKHATSNDSPTFSAAAAAGKVQAPAADADESEPASAAQPASSSATLAPTTWALPAEAPEGHPRRSEVVSAEEPIDISADLADDPFQRRDTEIRHANDDRLPVQIWVTGKRGTGQTTLARSLADAMGVALVSADSAVAAAMTDAARHRKHSAAKAAATAATATDPEAPTADDPAATEGTAADAARGEDGGAEGEEGNAENDGGEIAADAAGGDADAAQPEEPAEVDLDDLDAVAALVDALKAGQAVDIELLVARAVVRAVRGNLGFVVDGGLHSTSLVHTCQRHLQSLNPTGGPCIDLAFPNFVVNLDMDEADRTLRRASLRLDVVSGLLVSRSGLAEQEAKSVAATVARAAAEAAEDWEGDLPPLAGEAAPPLFGPEALVVRRAQDVATAAPAMPCTDPGSPIEALLHGAEPPPGTQVLSLDPRQPPADLLRESLMLICGALPPHGVVPFPCPAVAVTVDQGADAAGQRKQLLYGEVQPVEPPPQFGPEEVHDPEAAAEAAAEALAEAQAAFARAVVPGEARQWGAFHTYCPVAWAQDGENAVVQGLPSLAVVYRGRVYLTSTPEARGAFTADPVRYLQRAPQLRNDKWNVVVLGPASSGLEKHASSIADEYGLRTVPGMATLVEKYISSPGDSEEHEELNGLARTALPTLTAGQPLTSEQTSQFTIAALRHGPWSDRGYVLCGHAIPEAVTAAMSDEEQAVALPDVVVVMECSAGDEGAAPDDVLDQRRVPQVEVGGPALVPERAIRAAQATALADTIARFEAAGVLVRRVECGGPDRDVRGLMCQAIDPFYERPDPVGERAPPLEDPSGGPTGDSRTFCPVLLTDERALVPGKAEFESSAHGCTYHMGSKAALAAFEADPARFLPAAEGSKDIRVHVLVLGPRGGGLDVMAGQVAGSLGLSLLDLSQDVGVVDGQEALAAAAAEAGEGEAAGPLPDDTVAAAYLRGLEAAATGATEDGNKGVLVFGDTTMLTPGVLTLVLEKQKHPSTVIHLTMPVAVATARLLEAQFEWQPPPLPPPPEDEEEEAEPAPTKAELAELRATAEEEKRQELTAMVEGDVELVGAILDVVRGEGVEVAKPVNGDASQPRVVERLIAVAGGYVGTGLQALLVQAEAVSSARVDQLLRSGYAGISKFGPYCPVLWGDSQGGGSAPQASDEESLGGGCGAAPRMARAEQVVDCAVLYRRAVYFTSDAASRAAFLKDPRRFTLVPAPPPMVAPTCCIVGSPLAGKTTLSEQLVASIGVVHVTPETAVEWATSGARLDTALAQELHKVLQNVPGNRAGSVRGVASKHHRAKAALDDALVIRALHARVLAVDCRTRGYVLDGFPTTAKQAAAMSEAGNGELVPGLVLSLSMSYQGLLRRAKNGWQHARQAATASGDVWAYGNTYDPRVIGSRAELWDTEGPEVEAFFVSNFDNVRSISADDTTGGTKGTDVSRWQVHNAARKSLCGQNQLHRVHARAASLPGTAAPIAGVPLATGLLKRRRGHLGCYCPVELKERGELVATKADAMGNRRYAAVYQGKFYWCAGPSQLRRFVCDPSSFLLDTLENNLPQELPVHISVGSLLNNGNRFELSLQGYCPVSYAEGQGARDWSSIVLANPQLLVAHGGNIYGFSNPRQMGKFMRTPEKYTNQTLPRKLPPQVRRLTPQEVAGNTGAFGCVGTVEQGMQDIIQAALGALASQRLKHPACSPAASSIKYVSLFIKAHNPKNKDHVTAKYKARLQEFVNECGLAPFITANSGGGSGASAVRRAKGKASMASADLLAKAAEFEALCGQSNDKLVERFIR